MIIETKSKLFILGNGFDIAHDLPTRYSHFRRYLEQIQGIDTNEFDNRNRASIITYFDRRCDGEDWRDIEYALGLFPLYLEGYNPDIDDRKEKEKYVFYQSSLLLEVIYAFRRWVNLCLSIRNCIKRAPKSTVPGQHRFGFEKPRFCSL